MRAELIDRMGSDLTVVNAARVSFNKESDWEYTQYRNGHCQTDFGIEQHLSDSDAKLIRYLAAHNHWTPFSHAMITMREVVPIFVARQRFKHTVGFAYNEVSRRYVDEPPEFYQPNVWRGRPVNSKQGSSDVVIPELTIKWGDLPWNYRQVIELCEEYYNEMIKAGIAPEQARMVLPQSMYTEYYVTGSLAAWARAYKLRIDPHAQKEIQDLAKYWDEIIQPLFPVSWANLTGGK